MSEETYAAQRKRQKLEKQQEAARKADCALRMEHIGQSITFSVDDNQPTVPHHPDYITVKCFEGCIWLPVAFGPMTGRNMSKWVHFFTYADVNKACQYGRRDKLPVPKHSLEELGRKVQQRRQEQRKATKAEEDAWEMVKNLWKVWERARTSAEKDGLRALKGDLASKESSAMNVSHNDAPQMDEDFDMDMGGYDADTEQDHVKVLRLRKRRRGGKGPTTGKEAEAVNSRLAAWLKQMKDLKAGPDFAVFFALAPDGAIESDLGWKAMAGCSGCHNDVAKKLTEVGLEETQAREFQYCRNHPVRSLFVQGVFPATPVDPNIVFTRKLLYLFLTQRSKQKMSPSSFIQSCLKVQSNFGRFGNKLSMDLQFDLDRRFREAHQWFADAVSFVEDVVSGRRPLVQHDSVPSEAPSPAASTQPSAPALPLEYSAKALQRVLHLVRTCPMCFSWLLISDPVEREKMRPPRHQPHIIVSMDGNLSHKRRARTNAAVGDYAPATEPRFFVSDERVAAAEVYVARVRKASPSSTTPEHLEHLRAWQADNGTSKSGNTGCDVNGLFVCTCVHSRALLICNIRSAGETHALGVALLHELICILRGLTGDEADINKERENEDQHSIVASPSQLQHGLADEKLVIGVAYDIGCSFGDAFHKRKFLSQHHRHARLLFCTSKFHARSHDAPCQLRTSPEQLLGFRMVNGEDSERVWSTISFSVSMLRLSGYKNRILDLDRILAAAADAAQHDFIASLTFRLRAVLKFEQDARSSVEKSYRAFHTAASSSLTAPLPWESQRRDDYLRQLCAERREALALPETETQKLEKRLAAQAKKFVNLDQAMQDVEKQSLQTLADKRTERDSLERFFDNAGIVVSQEWNASKLVTHQAEFHQLVEDARSATSHDLSSGLRRLVQLREEVRAGEMVASSRGPLVDSARRLLTALIYTPKSAAAEALSLTTRHEDYEWKLIAAAVQCYKFELLNGQRQLEQASQELDQYSGTRNSGTLKTKVRNIRARRPALVARHDELVRELRGLHTQSDTSEVEFGNTTLPRVDDVESWQGVLVKGPRQPWSHSPDLRQAMYAVTLVARAQEELDRIAWEVLMVQNWYVLETERLTQMKELFRCLPTSESGATASVLQAHLSREKEKLDSLDARWSRKLSLTVPQPSQRRQPLADHVQAFQARREAESARRRLDEIETSSLQPSLLPLRTDLDMDADSDSEGVTEDEEDESEDDEVENRLARHVSELHVSEVEAGLTSLEIIA